MQAILDEMENYAKENRICIILPETRKFLKELCAKYNPQNILEVGTAIGFSASYMLLNSNAKITCCEASKPNIILAKQNFEKLNLTNRVEIIEGDCIKTLPSLNGRKFDLIFLDGPKGFYPQILKLLLPLLSESGVFVADNVEFRKMVSLGVEITEPRFDKTVKALREFLKDLKENKGLDTQIFPSLGDGIAVAKFKNLKK